MFSATRTETPVLADRVLCNAVRGISDLITVRGNINVDFADVRTIMTNRGRALMGTGYGRGDDRAVQAAEMAINSPLLEDLNVEGATGMLINITGGTDMSMNEVADAVSMIEDAADEDAHVIFGYVSLDEPCEEVKITVIATGFQPDESGQDLHRRGQERARPRHSGYYTSKTSAGGTGTKLPAESPEQVQVPAGGRMTPARTTVTSEKDLDIPTYLRRKSE